MKSHRRILRWLGVPGVGFRGCNPRIGGAQHGRYSTKYLSSLQAKSACNVGICGVLANSWGTLFSFFLLRTQDPFQIREVISHFFLDIVVDNPNFSMIIRGMSWHRQTTLPGGWPTNRREDNVNFLCEKFVRLFVLR